MLSTPVVVRYDGSGEIIVAKGSISNSAVATSMAQDLLWKSDNLSGNHDGDSRRSAGNGARRSMTRDELKRLEAQLWRAADNLRANSDLKSSEYSIPVLGLIFLRFADNNYRRHEAEIVAEYQKLKGTRREKPISEIAVEKCGFYLPDHARYDHLLHLSDEKDIAKALKDAMKAIEEYKPELEGALPKDDY